MNHKFTPNVLLASVLAASLILGLLAVLGGGNALAQTGGDYDLTWWTADGGGAPVSGAQYALQGTAGQPEPGAVMTGGDLALTGGFWAGGLAQPLEVTDLRASRSGSALRLDWTAVTRDVEANALSGVTYDIYRGVDTPYFVAATPYDTGIPDTWYLDPGVTGDAQHSYYYLVRAVHSGLASADSNRVGCFTFKLVPGGPSADRQP